MDRFVAVEHRNRFALAGVKDTVPQQLPSFGHTSVPWKVTRLEPVPGGFDFSKNFSLVTPAGTILSQLLRHYQIEERLAMRGW